MAGFAFASLSWSQTCIKRLDYNSESWQQYLPIFLANYMMISVCVAQNVMSDLIVNSSCTDQM